MKFIISFLFLLITTLAHTQHNFLRYSLQEGLPQSQVYAITEDLDGYLWVGTQGGGLAKFDGLEFQNNLQLPDNYINALATDKKGQIWIGTNSTLLCYFGDSIQSIPSLVQKITALKIDENQIVWIGTPKGLFFLDTQTQPFKIQKKEIFKNTFIRSFFFKDSQNWVATNRGAWELKSNKRYSIKNGLESNDVHAIFKDILGQLWISTFDGRIALFDTDTDDLIRSLTIPNNGHPQFIDQVGDDIWVGTINNGIATYNIDSRNWSSIDDRNGLNSKNIKTIFHDSWHNIWIGTSGDGLLKSVGQEFVHYGIQAGLKGDNIYAIFHDSKGRILFSESGYGFSILENGRMQHFGQAQGFIDIKCKELLRTLRDVFGSGQKAKA